MSSRHAPGLVSASLLTFAIFLLHCSADDGGSAAPNRRRGSGGHGGAGAASGRDSGASGSGASSGSAAGGSAGSGGSTAGSGGSASGSGGSAAGSGGAGASAGAAGSGASGGSGGSGATLGTGGSGGSGHSVDAGGNSQEDGWTKFTLPPGAKAIYVTSAAVPAQNDGLSPEKPLSDVRAAIALVRPGDWLLFKRGDVFGSFPRVIVSGPDPAHPTLIGAYGAFDQPRPIFKGGMQINGGHTTLLENIAWVGVHIYNEAHDPKSPAFQAGADSGAIGLNLPVHNLLIEDALIEYGQVNFQGWEGAPQRNVRVRRSVVAFSWNASAHAQGIFADHVEGLLVEDSVFDHNGHYPGFAEPTKFNHNLYVQSTCSDVRLLNTISARGASHGFQLRPGGTAEGNLSLANALAGFVAGDNLGAQMNQVMRRNVALHGAKRDFSDAVGFEMWGGRDGAVFADNILSQSDSARVALNIPNDYQVNDSGNVVYKWGKFSDGASYPDPERTIATYHASIGGTPSMEAFLDGARRQRRGAWKNEYTAARVIAYIRAGFGK